MNGVKHHRLLLLAAMQVLLAAGCGLSHPAPGEQGPVVTLVDLGEHPRDFRDRTVMVRGWLVGQGEAPEGVWLTVAVSKEAMARARAERGTIGLPDGLNFLLPSGATSEILKGAEGKQLEMLIRVVDEVRLWDGRTALLIVAQQLATVELFDEP